MTARILTHRRPRRARFVRFAALWLVIVSTAALAPRPAAADVWRPASSAASRWQLGRVDADLVAWAAGASTAAACEAMRAARSRGASEVAAAALPARPGDIAVSWLTAAAPSSTEPTRLVASRWSSASPRAPPV